MGGMDIRRRVSLDLVVNMKLNAKMKMDYCDQSFGSRSGRHYGSMVT